MHDVSETREREQDLVSDSKGREIGVCHTAQRIVEPGTVLTLKVNSFGCSSCGEQVTGTDPDSAEFIEQHKRHDLHIEATITAPPEYAGQPFSAEWGMFEHRQ
jgi:hypothetical protein